MATKIKVYGIRYQVNKALIAGRLPISRMILRFFSLSSTKKLSFTLAVTLLLLFGQQGRAAGPLSDDATDRASLTQATLELERDILLLKEKYLAAEKTVLAIYLNVDNRPLTKLDSISIKLNDKDISQTSIEEKEFEILLAGGMKQLYIGALPQGSYRLKTSFQSGRKQFSNTYVLDKSAGRDNLKITLTNSVEQRNPEITYSLETWSTAQ